MVKSVSSRERLFAEKLMRLKCEFDEIEDDLEEREGSKRVDNFSNAAGALLMEFRMTWDVHHGWVFPWTDRLNGPFPMTAGKVD